MVRKLADKWEIVLAIICVCKLVSSADYYSVNALRTALHERARVHPVYCLNIPSFLTSPQK
jgi:hypothetical protein